jgi:hypothetical protein
LAMYARARKLHKLWVYEKRIIESKYPTLKQLRFRMMDHMDPDQGGSPHLRHVTECIRIIDQMEADKRGTSQQKSLSTNEKYKLSLNYMKMLERPSRYAYLDRFLPGEAPRSKHGSHTHAKKLPKGQVKMNLAPEDLARFKQV